MIAPQSLDTHLNFAVAGPLVPSGFLERPSSEDLASLFDREAAGVALDRYLLRLSRHESLCRLRLGRLAARFLDARAHHRLGFARLGDYAIERLGISARELQEAARVWRAIREIPRLAEAYRAGRLGWTKLRTVCEVVTEETAFEWIAAAETMNSRELAERVRTRQGSSGPGRDRGGPTERSQTAIDPPHRRSFPEHPAGGSTSDDESWIDGEPRLRLRIACPVHLRPLWRETFELASRSAGALLSAWQALEAVCAEAFSGAPIPKETSEEVASKAVVVAAARSARKHPAHDGLWVSNPAPANEHEPRKDREGSEENLGTLQKLITEHSRVDLEVFDAGLTDVLDNEDDGSENTANDTDLDGLDRGLHALLRSMQKIDGQLGLLLSVLARARLYRQFGYRTLGLYARERLGIGERKARALIRLQADPKDGHEALAEAYRSGQLSWVRALILLPVLSEHNARTWIVRAGRITVRRLQAEVRWALDMRDRTWPAFDPAPPELGATLEYTAAEAKRQMSARYPQETTERIRQRTDEGTVVSLIFTGPASVIALCREALQAYRDPADPYEPAWKAFERMLLHVHGHWQAVPRHPNPIHDRDGWRCRVPACSTRRNLQEHHVTYRSRGGTNARSNRISICAWHHLRGIHTGIVRACGDAERAIHWQLGPRLKLKEDVYVRS